MGSEVHCSWGKACLLLLLICSALVGAGCGRAGVYEEPDLGFAGGGYDCSSCSSPGSLDQGGEPDPGPCRLLPVIHGQLRNVYQPSDERYLNDHSLLFDSRGEIHVLGITGFGDGDPWSETELLHASSPSLLGDAWVEHPPALQAEGERVLWAPHVISRPDGGYAMFYYGGDGRLYRADTQSEELEGFSRTGWSLEAGRDAMVYRDLEAGSWLLYTTEINGLTGPELRSVVALRESLDLEHWSDRLFALLDPEPPLVDWGELESPFVVRNTRQDPGCHYLFVTATSSGCATYDRTLVFSSEDPRHFEWEPLTELRVHAAELIELDGRWFISSAGWTKRVGEPHRGLNLAELRWLDRGA